MDKKELLDVASDLFRVVELQIVEMEKLRNKVKELQEKLSRPTKYAGDLAGLCPFCDMPFSEHNMECPRSFPEPKCPQCKTLMEFCCPQCSFGVTPSA